jgi:hypothetical protein
MLESKAVTREEFVSPLLVGNTSAVLERPALIPPRRNFLPSKPSCPIGAAGVTWRLFLYASLATDSA